VSGADVQALAPHLALGALVVGLLLLVSFRRGHVLAALVTGLGLGAALVAVWAAAQAAPRQITPLLVVDGYSLYLCALFLAAALVVTVFSHRYLRRGHAEPEEYYLLLVAATLGAATLASASHFATVLLGLEILSIALYVLIAYPEEGHPPLEAALKYLVLSGAASAMLLFGAALIYAASGALDFAALDAAHPGGGAGSGGAFDGVYQTAGAVLVLVGIGFKLSLVPFHMWTPDVYQGAPAPLSGYLATVSKGAVLAVLVRVMHDAGFLASDAVVTALLVVAVLSMIVGNLLALLQQHFKRLLAYSAIAHLGYVLVPLLALGRADSDMAVEATLVYLGAYFVMTLAAFGVVSELSDADEADHLTAYEGLFWRHPVLAGVLAIVLLSLAGIPLTLGFIAKFYLFAAGVAAREWLLLSALVAGSGIGLYYYLRVILVMARTAEHVGAPAGAGRLGLWTVCLLATALVALGIYPVPLIEIVREALQGWGR
jgi:NADH-quinone oxidoreductase subunit N